MTYTFANNPSNKPTVNQSQKTTGGTKSGAVKYQQCIYNTKKQAFAITCMQYQSL